MNRILLILVCVGLGACARTQPVPFSYSTITHYGYTNPAHVQLSQSTPMYNSPAPAGPRGYTGINRMFAPEY